MADPDFTDPDFPDMDFHFVTPGLLRHCVDTHGKDDFDRDADFDSYFRRNPTFFCKTKRPDAVSSQAFSESTTTKSVALKSQSSPKPQQNCDHDSDRDHKRIMKISELRVLKVKLLDFLNSC